MKAFLMAAGFGTRLRPLTDTLPKSLIPVNEIPSICYALLHIREAGIHDIVCNVHYRSTDVIKFFDDHKNFGFNVSFSHEDEILGTGGGVMKCRSQLKDDDFMVINSDVVTDIDSTDFLQKFKNSSSPGMIGIKEKRQDATVSIEERRVIDFKNDLSTNSHPAYDYMGIALLSPLVFDYLEKDFSSIVYTGYTGLIKNHELHYYDHKGFWYDIGTIETLKSTGKLLKPEKIFIERMKNAAVIPIS